MDENGLSRAGEWGRTTALLITNCVKSHVPLEWQALAVCRLQQTLAQGTQRRNYPQPTRGHLPPLCLSHPCPSALLRQLHEKRAETGKLFIAYVDKLQAEPPAGKRSDHRLINPKRLLLRCHLNLQAH